MLDNILSSLKRGVDRARTRSEEVAQTTKLRFEVYQLNRELDALYGRLGRAYHSGADVAVLQPIRDDIARVDDEIAARERLIAELGAHEDEAAPVAGAEGNFSVPHEGGTTVIAPRESGVEARTEGSSQANSPASMAYRVPESADAATEPTPPAAVTSTPGVPSAASIYQAKRHEEQTMTNDDERRFVTDDHGLTPAQRENPLISHTNERSPDKDMPNEDYQQRLDEGQRVSQGTKTDADLHGSGAPIPPIGTLAGNPQGILRAPVTPNVDTEQVHERNLRKEEHVEAERASRDPNPLDD